MRQAPSLPEGFAEYLAATRPVRAEPPLTLDQQRLLADRNAALIAVARPAGMTVADTFVVGGGMETPVRIYRPGPDAAGALVYFHGGGFTSGSIETYDPLAVSLAEASGACVLSVGYRRLPEASPSAILDEAERVFAWTLSFAGELGLDAGRIGVAGDSAGAMIAGLLAARLRDAGGPLPACQALFYGVFDMNAQVPEGGAEDPVLSRPVLAAIAATFRECDARDPLDRPQPGREHAPGLPPAVMIHAGLDPLREQGEAHARRLAEAGVRVIARTAAGMPHGFLRAVRFSPDVREEMRWLGRAIAELI